MTSLMTADVLPDDLPHQVSIDTLRDCTSDCMLMTSLTR